MKKLFYSLFALAALAMTNTSCSDELENGGINPNEAAVTFTVQLENNVGSRAIGDGTTAKNLYFAVYKAETGKIGDEVEALRQRVDVQPDLTATINTRLVKGQTYNFVFWAQTEEMTVEQSLAGDGTYYNLADMSSIKVNYGEDNAYPNVKVTPANNEERDAFYARRNDLKITGPINETIILKRPFAQVNVGTLVGSLAEAATAEVNIASSEITFSEVATEFHPYDGTVGEETTDVKITYTSNAIPESNKTDNVGDLKEVADDDYEYLSMNYILVADRATDGTNPANGERKAIIPNATFEIFDVNGTSINSFEIPNIPVQRNWRTNIIGDILSSNVIFNIIIDPDFDNDIMYPDLLFAAAAGGEVTLKENVELEQSLVVAEGVNMVLNLNGNTITNKLGNSATDAIIVEEGATLTINGDGDITAVTGNDGYAVISEGTLIINGGTYHAGVDENEETNAVIYARGNGKIYVNGGTFPNEANSAFVLNKKDSDRATTEIVVKGGTFTNFDPANNAAEGTGTNFVAEGYKVTNVGDYYYVTKEDVTAAANATDLASALATAGEVAMVEDVTIASTVTIADGATLDGQGNEIAVEETDDLSTMLTSNTLRFIQTQGNATFKDLVIDGNNASYNGYGIRGIFLTGAGTVTIENVTIKNVTYTINDDSATKTVKVKNSTLEGWTSYDSNTTGEFENVNFTKGTYATFRPHGTTTLIDCSFEKDFELLLDKLADGKTVTIKNCTYNGTPITSANIADLAEGYEDGDIIF